jgi:hypothetical protein
MAQQTAFEWLISKSLSWNRNRENGNDYLEFPKDAIKQAKAMEKEQIIKAAQIVLWNNVSHSRKEAEQYYNQTYESNKIKPYIPTTKHKTRTTKKHKNAQ